jgi:tetratricopeptide (TPR) repeat protein
MAVADCSCSHRKITAFSPDEPPPGATGAPLSPVKDQMPVKVTRAVLTAALLGAAAAHPAAASQQASEPAFSGSYLAGRSASKLRDNAQASGYFARALQSDADNPLLVERVFLLELAGGNMAAAEEYATRVLSFNSQQRMARIVLGLRDFRNRHYEKAREHFKAAAYTPVGELTAALLTAWSHTGEGELNLALKALDRLDVNESFANFKSFHAALIADYLGNAIRAEASYKKAYDEAGSSLRVVQAYGNFLERTGRAAEAQRIYESFVAGGDDNPLVADALAKARQGVKPAPFIATPAAGASEALFSLATSMTDEQSIDVALLYTQLALSLNADRPVTLTLLADTFGDMKLYEEAIRAYGQIPETSPLRANAVMEIAVALQRLDRREEALKELNVLVNREPANYDAIVTLGNLYRNNEDYADAASTYERAIALIRATEPGHWRVYYYSGIAYERLKQWEKAEKQFRRAIEISPNEAMVLNYLGYSMIEKKINLAEALEMVKKAVELKPNDGYITDSLGWAYYQLGDYEQAVVHVERAVELLPADPIIAEHLGDAYWRVGRRLEAKFQWQHAKDNKPEPADLARINGKLKDGLPEEPPVTPVQNGTGSTNG